MKLMFERAEAGFNINRVEYLHDVLQKKLEKLASFSLEGVVIPWMQQVAVEIAPMARQFVLTNYQSSDVGKGGKKNRYTSTGKLESAVAGAVVSVEQGRGGLRLEIGLKAGMGPYQSSKGSRSDFYAAANAVQHGSVRLPKGMHIGSRTRKRLNKQTRQQRSTMEGPSRVIEKTFIGARVVITKAFHYFYLTPSQKVRLEAAFWNGVARKMNEALGG